MGSIFQGDLLTLVPFDLERPNSAGYREVQHIYKGQPRPCHKGAVPQHSNFGGSLLFMHTSFDAGLLNLSW